MFCIYRKTEKINQMGTFMLVSSCQHKTQKGCYISVPTVCDDCKLRAKQLPTAEIQLDNTTIYSRNKLRKMKKYELMELVNLRGIILGSNTTNAAIIEMILQAQQAQ